MAYCMTQNDGREWLTALRDIPSKSAEDSLATWLEIVDDINERNKVVGKKKKIGVETERYQSHGSLQGMQTRKKASRESDASLDFQRSGTVEPRSKLPAY